MTPEIVIPAKQAVSNCPLSLWERVGVRVFGVSTPLDGVNNGRAGLLGRPHPASGHPLPEGEGF